MLRLAQERCGAHKVHCALGQERASAQRCDHGARALVLPATTYAQGCCAVLRAAGSARCLLPKLTAAERRPWHVLPLARSACASLRGLVKLNTRARTNPPWCPARKVSAVQLDEPLPRAWGVAVLCPTCC